MNIIYIIFGILLIIINIFAFFCTRDYLERNFRYIMAFIGLLIGILGILGAL